MLSFCGIFLLFSANAKICNIPSVYYSIQEGIDSSANGDTILVQPGIYLENINYHGKNVVVASLYLTTGDTSYISSTTITSSPILPLPPTDCSIVTFNNGETHSAQLIGFTLTGGLGNPRHYGPEWVLYGGGIFCDNSSPTLSHLIIKTNTAECGGGVFLHVSNAIIENCLIKDHVLNSTMYTSPDAGGAVACVNCTNAIIRNCIILNNTVSTAGAAIYSIMSSVSVVNCLITSNHSMDMGSAFYADSRSNLKIINSTLYGNKCDSGPGNMVAGTIYCIDSAHVHINNSIFWNNKPAIIVCQINYSPSEITVSHSDLQGGIDSIITNGNATVNWLSGNINTFPMFVDTALNNFHLKNTSPCINTGDTTGLSNIPFYDLDNNNRFINAIDMGCYENQTAAGIIITSNEIQNQLVFYPNPASDYLFIKRITNSKEPINMALCNLSGQTISSVQLNNEQKITQLDLSNIASGIYFIKIQSAQNFSQYKIVIAH